MHILILDTVHGGDILADILMGKGHRVTCVDVYGIASDELMGRLSSDGAHAVRLPVPEGHYDLLLSPVHCPDRFLSNVTWDSRKTFHQAVGDLIDDGRFRVEVTGVKGKTSACYLLAHILNADGRKVYLHSSRGQGPWTDGAHSIDDKVSIAPTSMLRIPKGDFDAVICESSLGGSGKADIAAITNLADDYGIAENTGRASDAKSSILCDNINIVRRDEMGIWRRYGGHDLTPYGERVTVMNDPKIGGPLELSIDYRGTHKVKMKGSYIPLQYLDSVELVLEICNAMGLSADSVVKGLESFNGVPGRGELSFRDGRWVVRERNPGISHLSIGHTLDILNSMGALEGSAMLIDPVNRKVCEKMDMDSIRGVAERYGVDVIMAGDDVKIPECGILIEFIKEGYQ